ncbi:MAG: DUF1854 domain-containing protein [Candidatus Latescibacteria bacterium]|nr:DUF1854 domain-containing protein [Candidatus Latescibacterota bacterium]
MIFLKPETLRLDRTPSGEIRMSLDGEPTFTPVTIMQAAPLSYPGQYICFLDALERVVGIIKDTDKLDPSDRQTVHEELVQRYQTTAIERIFSLKHENRMLYWDILTDQGREEILLEDEEDNIRRLDTGRVLLTDVDGKRFEIPDPEKLDTGSRKALRKVL